MEEYAKPTCFCFSFFLIEFCDMSMKEWNSLEV